MNESEGQCSNPIVHKSPATRAQCKHWPFPLPRSRKPKIDRSEAIDQDLEAVPLVAAAFRSGFEKKDDTLIQKGKQIS
ncbi:hypothetical protein BELL_0168g00230 [Botrytis elliptica]|uniref:Uncharacterized protein n=1 Tax=Botrytis elliptica TaxID=278938 RepID=A0A4Z1JY75_9HELO|nr:hypothetical protein BELL_0168g00230 [Botrytis elliptica]